jgi:hypothetical protein
MRRLSLYVQTSLILGIQQLAGKTALGHTLIVLTSTWLPPGKSLFWASTYSDRVFSIGQSIASNSLLRVGGHWQWRLLGC